jgi:lipid II:glycine glycyltransferase (peptidoglycan interpeptide bridge formation enzyme)
LYNKLLQDQGFQPLKEGRSTYWIDLTLTEEQMLSKMRRKTRYEVKRGIGSGIRIREVVDPDENVISEFWRYYYKLGKNKNFSMLPEIKFKNELRILLETKFASLFVAEFNDRIINFSMASKRGIASYMYGAINPDTTSMEGCPSPGHLVQWEMIRTMKNYGLKIYDMGFCPAAIPYASHPLFNIWHFKYGFGGMHVKYMPVYGKILNPVRGAVLKFLISRK